MPRKFHHEKLQCDSVHSAAAVRATLDAVSSSSERGHACISAMVNHCQQGTSRHHSAGSGTLVEHQLLMVVEFQITVVETVDG